MLEVLFKFETLTYFLCALIVLISLPIFILSSHEPQATSHRNLIQRIIFTLAAMFIVGGDHIYLVTLGVALLLISALKDKNWLVYIILILFLTYGLVVVYCLTGQLYFSKLGDVLTMPVGGKSYLYAGFMMMFASIACLAGLFPFTPLIEHAQNRLAKLHFQGVVLIAAVSILFKISDLKIVFESQMFSTTLLIIVVATMFWGNIAALGAKKFSKWFDYLFIVQSGFIFSTFVLFGDDKILAGEVQLFLLAAILVTAIGFNVIFSEIEKQVEALEFASFEGLWRKSPWFLFVLVLFAFSWIGMPPSIGLFAKANLLSASLKSGMIWFAVLLIVNTLLLAANFVRFFTYTFKTSQEAKELTMSYVGFAIVFFVILFVVYFGLFPTILYKLIDWCI